MPADMETAKKIKLKHITEIAASLGIKEDDLTLYGKYKAKLPLSLIDPEKVKKNGSFVIIVDIFWDSATHSADESSA